MKRRKTKKKPTPTKQVMIRVGRAYSPKEIFDNITTVEKKDFGGDKIKMGSLRYKVFREKLECVQCGIKGEYFYKEKHTSNDTVFHFNLYAIDEKGNEVLMTKDHIIPKSKGGVDNMSNLVTMCSPCNLMKGNEIIS